MRFLLAFLCLCFMADKAPLVIDAGQVRQAAAGDVIVCPSIKDSALTSTRIVLAGVAGVLEDDANLTYDGNVLSVRSLNLISTTSSTLGVIFHSFTRFIHAYMDPTTAGENIFLGLNSGNFTLSAGGGAPTLASRNVGLGAATLRSLTTGASNMAIGSSALLNLTTGAENTAIGSHAQYYNDTGTGNVALGSNALVTNIAGNYNVGIGINAGFSVLGTGNTLIGYSAGYFMAGSYSVLIGRYAGYYETAGNKLFIDNKPRGDEADARVKALIYGVFAAAPVDQDLTFNAQVGVNIPPTAWLTLRAGSAAAGTAPLKMTSGVLLTTPEAGVLEFYDGRYYITAADARRVVSRASDSIIAAQTVHTSTAETTVFTAVLTANSMKAGKVYELLGYGEASTHNASATLTVRIKVNGTTLTTLACIPGQAANDPLDLRLTFTTRTVGAAGTISSHGCIRVKNSEQHTNTSSTVVNTTIANNITVTFQWSASHASNTVALDQAYLKINN